MAGYRKKNADGPNSEDKALDLFAEMMIEKIEGIQKDWKKPWFTEGTLQWPRNLHGREYNGMNAFMLLLHCEKEGYKIPRFCTFDCVQKLNKPGKDGEELPRVSVRPFLEYSGTIYYGLTVNPANGEVYIADAIDYQQQGMIYRYSPEGKLIDEFYVGIIPGAFCWK